MRKLLAFCVLPAVAGCLTATVPDVAEWTLETDASAVRLETTDDATRLSQLVVRAPYDGCAFRVLRSDGTLADDSFNKFASIPSQLLKGPALEALNASGKLGVVVSSSSSATVTRILEMTVTRLRLDCARTAAEPDRRVAEAAVSILVLDRTRAIVGRVDGIGKSDARDGNYGAAFTKAFTQAVAEAVKTL